ncbi:hypothetical protein CVT25_007768 [Psilocybe cyanescens]|uniref:Uncharacterized protein n=1 Tax=Psilocybe cyanescens TaxID=93625 RepID=A0A409XHY8_PSICY|nr:hypothetical protein CVT25_007768 [Psilocybe cyanescens]
MENSLITQDAAAEVLRRQSDPSCSSPDNCDCTSTIQQAAQTCLNCVTSTDASEAASMGIDPAALAAEFNSQCASSGISLTIGQTAPTSSATGASGGAGSTPVSGGPATITSPASGSTTPPSSGGATGGSSGSSNGGGPSSSSPQSQGGSTSSNQNSGGERVMLGSYGLAAGLFILITSRVM